ncbi:hypothetical protein L2E82_37909 [Cichorium intybus]|uniref:Uncharacterized protein n=1 Tax=Cichorium intybus TaxID=13427 RepID=A0ACB9AFJ7_CICIN|nr:hypothetical protein L2E82_37909 [Cichorium intybus]
MKFRYLTTLRFHNPEITYKDKSIKYTELVQAQFTYSISAAFSDEHKIQGVDSHGVIDCVAKVDVRREKGYSEERWVREVFRNMRPDRIVNRAVAVSPNVIHLYLKANACKKATSGEPGHEEAEKYGTEAKYHNLK